MGSVLYLFSNPRDPASARRCRQLTAAGHDVEAFGYDWALPSNSGDERTVYRLLPRVPRGLSPGRLLALVRLVLRDRGRLLRAIRRADVIVARNLEFAVPALLAAWLTRSPARCYYEILDIHPSLTGAGPAGTILRALERIVLSRFVPLVSSPGFVEHYLGPVQGYRGTSILVENRLAPTGDAAAAAFSAASREAAIAAQRARRPGRPWRVGLVGKLRCVRTLEVLGALVRRRPDLIELRIHGFPDDPSSAERRRHRALFDEVAALPNVTAAPFRYPQDLAAVYRDMDLCWMAIHDGDNDRNSAWLMPNRYYEAGFHGVPAIVRAGTVVGRRVEQAGTGWSFADPDADTLERFLDGLDAPAWRSRVEALARCPLAAFVDDRAGLDLAALAGGIGGVTDRPEAVGAAR